MINEIKNQHVHLFWAVMATGLLARLGVRFVLTGLIVGVLVEAYQLIFKKEGWKIYDRLLDITFWALGSPIALYVLGVK
ncbi:MAG TPA: hypothetical protein PLL10_00245 [Elusimicrobiales bacterium]|nr:hypothetical protein [Elusimicrobiales bacterium]